MSDKTALIYGSTGESLEERQLAEKTMKQDYQFQILTMLDAFNHRHHRSVHRPLHALKADGQLESSLTRQAERQETTDGVIKSPRPALDGLEIKASRAAGMAESASRTSDMALNAVGLLGRELEKRKP